MKRLLAGVTAAVDRPAARGGRARRRRSASRLVAARASSRPLAEAEARAPLRLSGAPARRVLSLPRATGGAAAGLRAGARAASARRRAAGQHRFSPVLLDAAAHPTPGERRGSPGTRPRTPLNFAVAGRSRLCYPRSAVKRLLRNLVLFSLAMWLPVQAVAVPLLALKCANPEGGMMHGVIQQTHAPHHHDGGDTGHDHDGSDEGPGPGSHFCWHHFSAISASAAPDRADQPGFSAAIFVLRHYHFFPEQLHRPPLADLV